MGPKGIANEVHPSLDASLQVAVCRAIVESVEVRAS